MIEESSTINSFIACYEQITCQAYIEPFNIESTDLNNDNVDLTMI